MDTVLDPVLAPLDHLRVLGIRLLGPVGRTLVVRREWRIAVAGTLGVAVAFLLTAAVPTWVIAFSPLILGVPHLLADVRYLVVRPGLHRRLALWALVGGALAAVVITEDARVGLLAVPAAAIAARGPNRAFVLAASAVLLAAALWAGRYWTGMAMAHGHNLVAMGIFVLWRRRGTSWHWAPVLAFAALYLALLGGLVPVSAVPGPAGQDMALHRSWYATGLPSPWADRLVLSFAFAQSVHYGVWLRLVPDEDQARSTTRTLRRTLQDTVADLGWPITIGAAVLAVGFVAWGLVDPLAARRGYLDLALGHGYLELAALAWWVSDRGPTPYPGRPARPPGGGGRPGSR